MEGRWKEEEGGRGVGDGREALMGDAGAHDEGKQERREQGKKGQAWAEAGCGGITVGAQRTDLASSWVVVCDVGGRIS